MCYVYMESCASGKNNQDRVAVVVRDKGLIIALADGAGGFGDGALVAQFIVDKAIEAYNEHILVGPLECASLLAKLDRLLIAQGEQGESTAVILVVLNGFIYGASVGDSGALLIQHNTVLELTEHQRRKPLIGTGRANPAAFGPTSFEGIILVASDGLLKYTSMERITNVIAANASDDIPNHLIDLVRLGGNALSDDTTVVICSPLLAMEP